MMSAMDAFNQRQFSQVTLLKTGRKYNPATGQQDHALGGYIPQEQAIYGGWNHWSGHDSGEPMSYSTRNDPKPVAAPEIGSFSSPKKRLPDPPAGHQKQKTDYGEGAGFPRNGGQGFLFAHEAPARDQNARQHIGYATRHDYGSKSGVKPDGAGGYKSYSKPAPQSVPSDDYGTRQVIPYDTRVVKGSLTGHFDPSAPLYHGTKKALKGDQIVPGKYKAIDQVGQTNGLAKDGYRRNAYATPDKELAGGFSKTAKGKAGKVSKVYEVKPTGPVSADLEYLNGAGDPHEISDAIKGNTANNKSRVANPLPAVKSPKPFNVLNEVQF